MTPTKTRSLDAAVDLLGTGGLRALTHARIDERAGLPKGSTSNYFRTRAALLSGVLDQILQREMAEFATSFSPSTGEDLVEALCGMFEQVTVSNQILTTARLVLFMEASHDDELREAINRGRAAMESWFVPAMARLGSRDPDGAAQAVIACFEGLVLHRIARHDHTNPRRLFECVVRGALG
jgi:DNA-binding transcriptional regulator YbjK